LKARLARLKEDSQTILPTLAELCLLLLWALFVGRSFLQWDQDWIPIGNEFGMVTQSYYLWPLLPECGTCVFWNGMVNGGSPAFVDLHGSLLNPLVILSTLLLGVINGSKLVLVLSLFLAGLAQWWLARVLGLGRLARIWSGAMTIVGGHLAGRMQLGLVSMILALAFGSLLIPAEIELLRTFSRRAAVAFGALLGLLALSGQGYAQYVVALGLVPAGLVLFVGRGLDKRVVCSRLTLAAALALLLSAPLWLPTLHFWPNMHIHGDPAFGGGQSVEYLPLNLVIRDLSFYNSPSLAKITAPSLFILYIGWIPVILAIVGIARSKRLGARTLAFILVSMALTFFLSSSNGTRLLARLLPSVAAMLRYPSLGAGLAIPLILGLAAVGLDALIQSDVMRFRVASLSGKNTVVQGWYLLLAVPLLFSLKSAYNLARVYLDIRPVQGFYRESLPLLTSEPTQWVATPVGDFAWYAVTQPRGILLANSFRPWGWIGREPVLPYFEGSYSQDITSDPDYIGTIAGVHWLVHPQNEFAFVDTASQQIPCRAQVRGGNIDVECTSETSGTLVVRQYALSGWTARRDGVPAQLVEGQWLSTEAPAGQHSYAFRYQPWDAPAGVALGAVGTMMAIAAWVRKERGPSAGHADHAGSRNQSPRGLARMDSDLKASAGSRRKPTAQRD
jgi:hypothetical protein